jgi:LPS-assembly protein
MKYICQAIVLLSLFMMIINNSFAARNLEQEKAFIKAKEVKYNAQEKIIEAKGDVIVNWYEYNLSADKIIYQVKEDLLIAGGNVRVQDKSGRVIYGERALIQTELKRAILENFSARFERDSIFAARSAFAKDESYVTMDNAVFTPCTIYCRKNPIWQVKAQHIDIDNKKQMVIYKNLFFEIYGNPIMFLPYFHHPTPKADAKSGLLVPRMKTSGVAVPFYVRVKPNVDFTISPRIGKHYMITEGQWRHKLLYGDYVLHGSIGNSGKAKAFSNSESLSQKQRFYIDTKGDFVTDKFLYGFHVKRTSDKAYILNYHNLLDSYLVSNLYLNNFDKYYFASFNAFHFQDLYTSANKANEPLILPQSNISYLVPLNDQESTFFSVNNDFMFLDNDGSDLEMLRNALEVNVTNSYVNNLGQIIQSGVHNRGDYYFWRSLQED